MENSTSSSITRTTFPRIDPNLFLLWRLKVGYEGLLCCSLSRNRYEGGPRSLLETIDALRQHGVECFVLLPGHGRLSSELSSRDVPACIIDYQRWVEELNYPLRMRLRKTLKNLCLAALIAVKIRQWQCDIVYTNTISIGVGALAAALLGIPHVWHIREFIYEDHGQAFDLGRNFTLRLVDLLSQVCIVNSNAVAQKYQQFITPSKLKVVYQAVNITLAGELSALLPPHQTSGALLWVH